MLKLHTQTHTHMCTHSFIHICMCRGKRLEKYTWNSQPFSQNSWNPVKDHPPPPLQCSGWLRRVLSEAPCAVTTEVPLATQKSQTGAHQLVSCTSEPAPPHLWEMPPPTAGCFHPMMPLPMATRSAGQAGSLLSSNEGSVYYCCRFDADPKRT